MRSSDVPPPIPLHLLMLLLLPLANAQLLQDHHQFVLFPAANLDGSTVEDQLSPPPDGQAESRLPPIVQWILSFLSGSGGDKPTTHPPPVAINQSECPPCKCGILNKQLRIVGGRPTYVNQYPWMCLLMYTGKFYCGGTLINHKYILTASHCVHGFNVKKISVRCYDHDRDVTNETAHEDRRVSRIKQHGGYSSTSFDNDLALLELTDAFDLAETGLRPACLPHARKSFTGSKGVVTGWGVKKAGGATSAVLQEVEVPIMSNADCRKTAYGADRITDNMMCAGFQEGKKDSCQGDSGGPLHVANDTRHHVVGVVSWGEGCAQPNHPGVYTRVNRYLTWIEKNTRDACQCNDHLDYGQPTPAASTVAPAPVYTEDPDVRRHTTHS